MLTSNTPSIHLPAIFSRMMRYHTGDEVWTPFGKGKILEVIEHNEDLHYEVEIKAVGIGHIQKGHLFPQLNSLSGKEIPEGTFIKLKHSLNEKALIQSYNVKEQSYEIKMQNDANIQTVKNDEIVLDNGCRVRTPFGIGTIISYSLMDKIETYTIKLDHGMTGYFQPSIVQAIDLRLLKHLPKPLTAEEIFQQLHGTITKEQAQLAANTAHQAHATFRTFCEQHSHRFSYGKLFLDQAMHLTNPEIQQAALEVEKLGKLEMMKLKTLAKETKQRLEEISNENELALESANLLKRSKAIIDAIGCSSEAKRLARDLEDQLKGKLKEEQSKEWITKVLDLLENQVQKQSTASHQLNSQNILKTIMQQQQEHQQDESSSKLESIARRQLEGLDVLEILSQAQELVPQMSTRAATIIKTGEEYLKKNNPKSQKLVEKAKQYVENAEKNEFSAQITNAIAQVDVKEWTAFGENLTNDAAARKQFGEKIKDQCLEFLLQVLPSIEVPPITGTKDEVEYSISELDLSNFSVRKENVQIRIGETSDNYKINDYEILTLKVVDITAVIPKFKWTFAQSYFPYLNGGGSADATIDGGSIILGFKAEKEKNKPKLSLSSISMDIKKELSIVVHGSWFSFVYNVLATLFAELVKDYLISTLETSLIDHMMELLTSLNELLEAGIEQPYWDTLLELTNISLDTLPDAEPWRGANPLDIQIGEIDMTFLEEGDLGLKLDRNTRSRHAIVVGWKDTMKDMEIRNNVPLNARIVAINGLSTRELTVNEVKKLIHSCSRPLMIRFSTVQEIEKKKKRVALETFDVIFGPGALGIKLRQRPLASVGVIVAGFLKLKDGRLGPAEKHGRIAPGHLIVRVNDTFVLDQPFEAVLSIIRESNRPVTIRFAENSDCVVKLRDWPPSIHLSIVNDQVVITGFKRILGTSLGERAGLKIGDQVIGINKRQFAPKDQPIVPYAEVMKQINQEVLQSKESIQMRFRAVKDPLELEFPKHALNMEFESTMNGETVIKQFVPSIGPAERSQLLYPGLILLQVGGQTIEEKDIAVVETMITNSQEPFSLTVRDPDAYDRLLRQENEQI